MQHIAIMKRELGFVEKILASHKTIESRWYRQRRAPWGQITPGDTIYFKDTGQLVTARATVAAVRQYSDLSPEKVTDLIREYGQAIGIESHHQKHFSDQWSTARYAVLIWLKNPAPVEPFQIKKTNYGAQAAWLCFESIGANGTLLK